MRRLMQSGAQTAPKPKKRRNRKNKTSARSVNLNQGEIVISRRELVNTVTLDQGKTESNGYLVLKPSNFTFLNTLSKSFERFKFMKVHIYYKPAVGTTYGGLIALGIDYDVQTPTTLTRAKVVAQTPSVSVPLWQDTEGRPLIIPPNRLQSRAWYVSTASDTVDTAPATLFFSASASSSSTKMTLGEIWVDYTVMFSGTGSA